MVVLERSMGPFDLDPADCFITFCSGLKKNHCCSYQDVGKEAWLYFKLRIRELERLGMRIERTEATCLGVCRAGPVMRIRMKNGKGKEYCLQAETPEEAKQKIDDILRKLFPTRQTA